MICLIFVELIPPAFPPLREELAVCFVIVNMFHICLNCQDTKSLQALWGQGECYLEIDLISSLFHSFTLLSNKVMLWRGFL